MIEVIRTEAEFQFLESSWQELHPSHPFLDFRWLHGWWKTFHGQNTLHIVVGRNGSGDIQFIAPWYLHNSASRGKEIRFLGSGQASSDYMTLLTKSEFEPSIVNELSEFLLEQQQEWDCMRFEGVQADDPWMNALVAALAEGGASSRVVDQPHFWRLALPNSYDEYVGNCQKKIRQKLRKVARDAGDQVSLELCGPEDDLVSWLDQFVALHISRRAQLGDSGCFCSHHFYDFLQLTTQQFHDSRQLWLGRVMFDDTPIASCLAMEQDGVLYFYQSGANPDYAKLQPGWLLNSQIIQLAIDRGMTAIDYLRGDEQYKARLSAEPTDQVRMHVVSTKATAVLRSKIWETGATLKNLALGAKPS